MALHGFPNLKIELDNVSDVLKNISAYVTEINGYTVEQVLEELTSAGTSSDRWGVVGFEQKAEIVLSGPYDDTGDGLVSITKDAEGLPAAGTRTLKLTFDNDGGPLDERTVECIIRTTDRAPSRAALHKYTVTLRPTGAVS